MKKQKTGPIFLFVSLVILAYGIHASAHEGHSFEEMMSSPEHSEFPEDFFEDDLELRPDLFEILGCTKANSSQIATVNQGNGKRTTFQSYCVQMTGSSTLCAQIERPNPSSVSTFRCTYGNAQPHRLIHPDQSTWKYAVKAIQLLQALSKKGICVSQIYNWWRPEPYNKNVGGAAGRHPYGTSVDVRFCTNSEAIKAFDLLCQYRKRGEIKALGYYGSTGVHLGVGDRTANTWGRGCK